MNTKNQMKNVTAVCGAVFLVALILAAFLTDIVLGLVTTSVLALLLGKCASDIAKEEEGQED